MIRFSCPVCKTVLETPETYAGTKLVCGKCGQWLQVPRPSQNKKYNAGDTFNVSRLSLAIFKRKIPNVETNLRVNGITYHSRAVYFLPERLLLIDGADVRNVPYPELEVMVDSLEYVESEGHVYRDSLVIDHRWKFINRDGSRDRRFKDNVELPVVRCGVLGLATGNTQLKMMTTDPDAPELVQERLNRLKTPLPRPRAG